MPEGRGKMVVRKSGQVLYFCGSKCQRNHRLGREGKKRKWTETSRKLREKEGLASRKALEGTKPTEQGKGSKLEAKVPPKPGEKPKAGRAEPNHSSDKKESK